MGLFDCVSVSGKQFACADGHSVEGCDFQTKDLGCTMGSAHVSDMLTLQSGKYGCAPRQPFTGVIEIYSTCEQCPAAVQRGTGNILGTCVEFEVEIFRNTVTNLKLVSRPSAEQLAEQIAKYDGVGPMSFREAQAMHMRGEAIE